MNGTTYDNIRNNVSYSDTLSANNVGVFSTSLLTFAAVMTFIIMIIGIFGNLLTVIALLKCPKVRNVAAAFIISLCLADLLFCILVLPFSGLRFLQGTWMHGVVLCRLIPFIQYGNIGVSLLCIAMITINRYVMITHHNSYGRIYKRYWIAAMIAFCWLFSYGMQLPTLFGAWGRFDYDPRLQTCSIMNDTHGHSSKTTLFITAFVIPCLIIIACYTKIFWVVHKSEQRLKQHANKQNSIPNNLRMIQSVTANVGTTANTAATAAKVASNEQAQLNSGPAHIVTDSSSNYSTDTKHNAESANTAKQQPTRLKDQREVRAKRNEWRITKMVLAIFLSFIVCYLPITIVKVADKNVEHPSWHIFSYIMLYLSACINPIIYVIMNKQYRKAYKTVILCEPSRLLLPFGKTNGQSSASEKWKDIGLSNNHSRTMVSQMSAGTCMGAGTSISKATSASMASGGPIRTSNSTLEQQNSTQNVNSPGQQPMIALELMTKPMTSQSDIKPVVPARPLTVLTNNSGSSQQNNVRLMFLSNGNASSHNSNSKPNHRITMVGDDIILEEEETPPATTDCNAIASLGTATITTTPYMNVLAPRKIQYYGQNINDIPASDTTVASVSKDSKCLLSN